MYIKCISRNRKRNLTVGKIYKVQREIPDIKTGEIIEYEFKNDIEKSTYLPVNCVKVVEVQKVEQLKFIDDFNNILGTWGTGKVTYIEEYKKYKGC